MNETTNERPAGIAHSEKIGRVRYDIEEREGKDGRFYSTRFYRLYKKDETESGEPNFEKAYTFATSERADDLEDLAKATAAANNWIQLQLEQAPAA